mmetsp:Transcript_68350/g.120660  ORF Transcript_68350/g.120660 Transcript_68350/m.120660 type:complete len:209 (-) Transcript_68350:3877-4503(-)
MSNLALHSKWSCIHLRTHCFHHRSGLRLPHLLSRCHPRISACRSPRARRTSRAELVSCGSIRTRCNCSRRRTRTGTRRCGLHCSSYTLILPGQHSVRTRFCSPDHRSRTAHCFHRRTPLQIQQLSHLRRYSCMAHQPDCSRHLSQRSTFHHSRHLLRCFHHHIAPGHFHSLSECHRHRCGSLLTQPRFAARRCTMPSLQKLRLAGGRK